MVHYRNDKLEKPRAKCWTREEYDYSPRRGFLDGRTTFFREGSLFCKSSEASPAIEDERAFDYAAAQGPENWIVNGHARHMEILRDPIADPSSGTGFRYSSSRVAGEHESISALAKPDSFVRVSELLVNKP